MARSQGAQEIVALATSATREAQNRKSFLQRLEQEANLVVSAISGKEEARLTYLGVSSGINMGERQGVFIDIGGGSTEIAVGDQSEHFFLDTLKLGSIRLAMLFPEVNDGSVSPDQYEALQGYVRDTAIRTLQVANRFRLDMAVGSSGTIENLADIAIRNFHKRRRESDDVLSRADLKGVAGMLCGLSVEERKKVPGINPDRADIIVTGASILDTILQELGLEEIQISDRSMRDGMLVDYLNRLGGEGSEQEQSFREASVLRLGRALSFDEEHASHVARLALRLFDISKEQGLHKLGRRERELLEYAAMLHDVGVSLSYSNHQSHSYYFIANAELLGFDQTEIAIMATTTLFHRKKFPRKRNKEFAALDDRSQSIVQVLGVLLSIAEGLDRSHMGLVRDMELELSGKRKAMLRIRATQACPLEAWGVEYHNKAFQKVFNRRLTIEVAVDAEKKTEVSSPA
jgi:exopolyphosphatase/guanosine-5'-triphosphate,3'-diphosphate pyrophosphatase